MSSSPSNSSTSNPPTLRRSAPAPIRWKSWPLSEGGLTVTFMMIVTTGVTIAVGLQTESVVLALVGTTAACFAGWRFFLPLEIELNSLGVVQKIFWRQRRIPWREIHYCEICRQGVYMGPTPVFPWRRGIYLPWGKHRAEVTRLLRYYLLIPISGIDLELEWSGVHPHSANSTSTQTSK